MKSANIIKFNTGKIIMYPKKRVKDKGSYASAPYTIKQDLTDGELARILLKTLEFSGEQESGPKDWKAFNKEHLKAMGMKSMKMLHEGSLNVSVFTKDGKYHISPSVNKGSRQGFHGTKERIIIPVNSSIDELADALKEAFEKSS